MFLLKIATFPTIENNLILFFFNNIWICPFRSSYFSSPILINRLPRAGLTTGEQLNCAESVSHGEGELLAFDVLFRLCAAQCRHSIGEFVCVCVLLLFFAKVGIGTATKVPIVLFPSI
jgi:hypothetical protein